MTDDLSGAAAGVGLDCSAAMVRAEADDFEVILEALAARLSSVPGLKVEVTHRHGRVRGLLGDLPYINELTGGAVPVRKIVVTVGSSVYRLESRSCMLKCTRETFGGTHCEEQLAVADWARFLLEDVEQHNLTNYESMAALRNLVELGRVD